MNFWKQALLNLRLIKVRRFLGSFFYSLQRDTLERHFQSSSIEVFAEIGNILSAEPTARGGKFYFQNVELEICFLADDLIRIDWQPGVLPILYTITRKDWPEIEVKFQELGDRWLISSAALKVIISLNGSVELQNAHGQTIREELPPQQKTSGWLHQAKLRSLEYIYGLGERAAPLNLRTTPATSSYQMWNYDAGGRYGPGTDPLYLCIPAYREDASLPQHSTQHSLEGRGGDHREAHNVYGLLQAEAAYEALSEYKPELRPFIVSRAGWVGLQRYAWTWTGDIETSWSGLRQTIPTILNLGLSGIPYSGADIGGFKGNPSAELYLLWFQMSTFLPFFRTHSANNVKPRTPWGFGEPTLSIVREFLQLRYKLMPYLYTLAWEANQRGYPLMRPLFWADSADKRLWDVEDTFLLGDVLLVAAIVESGATSRSITLPKGYWYNFWDDTLLEGANTVNITAPIEQIPILVKAGSILPMSVGEQLILHIYTHITLTSEGQVYSDAGDGYGEWRLDKFYLKHDACKEGGDRNILEITWQQQGDYAFPYTTVKLHFHGVEVEQAWIDNRKVNCQNNCLEVEQFQRVRLNFNSIKV
ncbi:TIM-barrel domain-containing protein [Nodularia sp. UHCC 0506]|uniref:TIM-barrel domain-containing protein n=1 Tax=Nodularia sp. UHCC 0506 TaxID=3110243 RepID=UPI002B2165C7|nr:TIM-barrel domain-containing protein [Nodularia sp. UHCC 0506]MEA5515546.1 TIM-barrel domain-containing protein [Nodularia sp. UHCC 0506]